MGPTPQPNRRHPGLPLGAPRHPGRTGPGTRGGPQDQDPLRPSLAHTRNLEHEGRLAGLPPRGLGETTTG
eukprot:4447550-Alexandrium_andersonii.AAC.1